MLLLTADVEKIAELASLKLGSKWFSSNRYDASDKLKMTPSPTLSENFTVTGNLVPRYESLVRDICPAPRLDILVQIYVLAIPIDLTAYKTKRYSLNLLIISY